MLDPNHDEAQHHRCNDVPFESRWQKTSHNNFHLLLLSMTKKNKKFYFQKTATTADKVVIISRCGGSTRQVSLSTPLLGIAWYRFLIDASFILKIFQWIFSKKEIKPIYLFLKNARPYSWLDIVMLRLPNPTRGQTDSMGWASLTTTTVSFTRVFAT